MAELTSAVIFDIKECNALYGPKNRLHKITFDVTMHLHHSSTKSNGDIKTDQEGGTFMLLFKIHPLGQIFP